MLFMVGSATEGVEEEDSVSEGAACQTENALPVSFCCLLPAFVTMVVTDRF